MNLLYLAKPIYGGWVTFTAHLSQIKDVNIFKIARRDEKKGRPFGYGTTYFNKKLDSIIGEELIITAIDKHYYSLLPYFYGQTIVIHDPTECKPQVLEHLHNFRVITIRKEVSRLLEANLIDNTFLPHPYVMFDEITSVKKKKGAISISRIDFDKNIDIILKANERLEEPIEIYGACNDLYVYHKLRQFNFDEYYKGKFPKSYQALQELIQDKKYVVDMSSINKDGGGSQYTFLEAIANHCCLILNEKWVKGKETDFKHLENCIIVKDEEELRLFLELDPDVKDITKNAFNLLKEHNGSEWNDI